MFSRRDFIRISGMASAAALMNWQCPSLARGGSAGEGKYDVVIIGAGLGGLACAGFLAKYGFKPLVIDQRDKPGGYATSFQRSVSRIDGEFICEASLHGVTGNPLSLALLGEEGLGVLDKLTRIPHKNSWSSLYPEPLYPGHQEPFLLDIPFYDTGLLAFIAW
jgi:prolycopene isomerase